MIVIIFCCFEYSWNFARRILASIELCYMRAKIYESTLISLLTLCTFSLHCHVNDNLGSHAIF